MNIYPSPIFKHRLPQISWQKIYVREYGVQYSEMAILCLSPKAKYHIPHPSVDQIVIPEGNNTAFYIDAASWQSLVASLNNTYTSHLTKLKSYEKQFKSCGKAYLIITQKIASLNLKSLTNKELLHLYQDYQDKLFRYSVFAWTSFVLNNFVAERATSILDGYLKKHKRESEKQEIYDVLFRPPKLAAVLKLQKEVNKYDGKLTVKQIDHLYERFKWLSCLDIHNKPWTKEEFEKHLSLLTKSPDRKEIAFTSIARKLKIGKKDLDYLLIAKRFVYIKDARDDYRRKGVFLALKLFEEIARRMDIKREDISFLKEKEIVNFLSGKSQISNQTISGRKKGFILYLDKRKSLVCLQGNIIIPTLKEFHLWEKEEKSEEVRGRVASQGCTKGFVVVVRGVKDLDKVAKGNILVAVATHPDYVPAMKKAAAIVTDEGGITSHAAIVSREFGIPCIVGTKNATKILKDGDKVIVNANLGLVKKIRGG